MMMHVRRHTLTLKFVVGRSPTLVFGNCLQSRRSITKLSPKTQRKGQQPLFYYTMPLLKSLRWTYCLAFISWCKMRDIQSSLPFPYVMTAKSKAVKGKKSRRLEVSDSSRDIPIVSKKKKKRNSCNIKKVLFLPFLHFKTHQ